MHSSTGCNHDMRARAHIVRETQLARPPVRHHARDVMTIERHACRILRKQGHRQAHLGQRVARHPQGEFEGLAGALKRHRDLTPEGGHGHRGTLEGSAWLWMHEDATPGLRGGG